MSTSARGSKAQQAGDSARRELLKIQRRLWRRLQAEIEASIAENPPNVDIYKEEYERDLVTYQDLSTKQELIEAAARSRIVYVGDYHTLPQAQRTLVKLLLALSKLHPQIVLCMEMVHIKDQAHLDAYMLEELSEEKFLRAIDYEVTWGFPWAPYKEIFAIARKRGMRVVGINSDPQEHDHDHLLERDFRTAVVVAREVLEDPEAVVVVFDGDLHVARDHLPFIVANYLEYEGEQDPPPAHLIVHQNADEIYWRLARERLEREINVVRLTDDSFCVLNATPLEKLHSYLNWVSEREVLEPPDTTSTWELIEEDEDEDEFDEEDEDDDEGTVDYSEQVHEVVCNVARFLGIERDDLDTFSVFTVNDLDFLDYLGGGSFTEQEVEDIKRQILSNESYFVPKGDIIYLADFSLVNAAEEATHFLHHKCSGYGWERPRSLEVDFYFRVMTETLGYFGSKVIVPTRECWRESDCLAFVAQHAQETEPDPKGTGVIAAASEERVKLLLSQQLTLHASALVLQHKSLERDYLATGKWVGAGATLTQSTELHLLITHMLGHMMGDLIYWGLIAGEIKKATIRKLFHEPLEKKGVALQRYLDLVELTADVDHGPARSERL